MHAARIGGSRKACREEGACAAAASSDARALSALSARPRGSPIHITGGFKMMLQFPIYRFNGKGQLLRTEELDKQSYSKILSRMGLLKYSEIYRVEQITRIFANFFLPPLASF
jgi:hypothetical protein